MAARAQRSGRTLRQFPLPRRRSKPERGTAGVESPSSFVHCGVPHSPKWRLGLLALVAGLVGLASTAARVDAPLAAPGQLCASPGRDGAGGTLAGTVNTYYPGTASVAAGATTIPVGAPTGSGTAVAAGDLVLVIQMQGADVNSTDTDAYGDGNAGGSASGALAGTTVAGLYEFAVATGPVTAGSLPVVGKGSGNGLLNAYVQAAATGATGARTFQVVRVPQFATATVGGGPDGVGLERLDRRRPRPRRDRGRDPGRHGERLRARVPRRRQPPTRRRRRSPRRRLPHERDEHDERRQGRGHRRHPALGAARGQRGRHRCRGLPERESRAGSAGDGGRRRHRRQPGGQRPEHGWRRRRQRRRGRPRWQCVVLQPSVRR